MSKPLKYILLLLLSISTLTFHYSCSDDESFDGNGDTPMSAIPEELTYYEINITGTTLIDFSRSGCLYITKSVENAINFNNGINEREVGIVSGFPAGNQETGAMWFFTNTNICQYGSTGCNSTIRDAALDIAFVSVEQNNRKISIQIDGQLYNNTAAGSILTSNYINHFTALSSFTASIYRTVTGSIQIDFSEDGERISGTIDIKGNNFTGTSNIPYMADFTGRRVLILANSCR